MALKRKRSDPNGSPASSCGSSTASSSSGYSRNGDSPSPSLRAFDFTFQQPPRQQFCWPAAGRSGQTQDLGSGRTRKRFRDNRPDEGTIYANTLHRLYDAPPRVFTTIGQHSHHYRVEHHSRVTDHVVPPLSLSSSGSVGMEGVEMFAPAPVQVVAPEQPQQQQPRSQASLHQFFNISRAPTSNVVPNVASGLGSSDSVLQCDDCDAVLPHSPDDGSMMLLDDAMDLGGIGGSAWGCRQCGRKVCDMCAVVDFGVGRECLGCRTRC